MLFAIAAMAAMAFVALYLGGYPWALAHERLGLVPLIAGLGGAVLEAYQRKHLSQLGASLGFLSLFVWVLFLECHT